MKRALLLTPLALALFACPKKEEATPTSAPPSAPPAAPTSQPAGAPPAGGAASQPGAQGAAPVGNPFTGLVKLADGVAKDTVKDTDVLFIMARERLPDGKPGRLLAVQRQGKVEYPFRYELGSKDVMMPGMPFAGPFLVQARLDRDGDPMTKGADDLYAEFESGVVSGQEGVHLTLASGGPAAQK